VYKRQGYTVCEHLKKSPITQNIPVIFLTALNEVSDETKGFEVGGADFISKPINPEIVKARINTHIALQKEKNKTEELLRVLLPENVITDLMEEGIHKPQIQDNVSIMFCDLVGFTGISSRLSPEFLIEELNDIYGYFDELCIRYRCSRIKTIGDAYMAATGIHQYDPDHADKLVRLGIEFIRFLNERNKTAKQEWKCRIGINSGSVIAGIIGKTRFIYDIFGHDVNVASRVESNGYEMKVTISASTQKLLKHQYPIQPMGFIQLKGTDAMELFSISIENTRFELARNFILNRLKRDLQESLTYHNVAHTEDVLQAAYQISIEEQISIQDRELLLTAAAFHDAGFLQQIADHEMISCAIAQKHLPEFGYSPLEIEKICGMIQATKIPQSPKNHLEEILADADLDYLGRDDFFSIGKTLFHELMHQGTVENEQQWNEIQVKFLTSHHYFTKSSIENRAKNKQKHLEQVKSFL
jgi:class 3 adenylate cyclase/predicted metal-dependent HD superfamily phosphohydrolase